MAGDPLRDWTDELARDPRSLVFLRLADLLRRHGHMDEARRVALGGLEQHPYLPDAHDVLARILVDAGDESQARDEWEMAMRLEPSHPGALKGLGFLAYRRGDLTAAERFLAQAVQTSPSDQGLVTAYRQIRAEVREGGARTRRTTDRGPAPARGPGARPAIGPRSGDPRLLFATLLGDGDRTALLLDRDGLTLAGTYLDAGGHEVADEIGAQLAGLAEEAGRALAQLGLGSWESLLVEAQHATVAMGPAVDGSLVLVAAARDSRVGLVRQLLARASRAAAAWLEGVA